MQKRHAIDCTAQRLSYNLHKFAKFSNWLQQDSHIRAQQTLLHGNRAQETADSFQACVWLHHINSSQMTHNHRMQHQRTVLANAMLLQTNRKAFVQRLCPTMRPKFLTASDSWDAQMHRLTIPSRCGRVIDQDGAKPKKKNLDAKQTLRVESALSFRIRRINAQRCALEQRCSQFPSNCECEESSTRCQQNCFPTCPSDRNQR